MKSEVYENMRIAIVQQVVDDYCTGVKQIALMNDVQRWMIRERKIDLKRISPKLYTFEELEELREEKFEMERLQLKMLERWFKTNDGRMLHGADPDYMITMTKQLAIDRLVRQGITDLRKVNEANKDTKKSKNALKEWHTLKLFLESDWLKDFTEKDGSYYIEKIKKDAKCDMV